MFHTFKSVKNWPVKCVKKAPTLTPYIHYRFFTTFGSLNIVGLYLKNIKSHSISFQSRQKVSKRSKKVQNGHFRVFRQSVGFLRKTLLFRTTFDLGVEKLSINRHFFMFFRHFYDFQRHLKSSSKLFKGFIKVIKSLIIVFITFNIV